MRSDFTPSQTIGPFFHDALLGSDLTELVSPDDAEAVRISGVVYDGAGEPVPDAMLELWQAGDDRHGSDDFSGFGRSGTDEGGRFSFTTIKPGPLIGPNGETEQAPHADILVFARGLLRQVTTRMYFPDEEEANAADPVLTLIEDPALRRTLIARDEGDGSYRFDVHLQGENQTAFFEFEG